MHRMTPSRSPFDRSTLATQWKDPYLDTDWGHLDCLGEIEGIGSYEEVTTQSVDFPLGSAKCRILTIDALTRAKEAMGGSISLPPTQSSQARPVDRSSVRARPLRNPSPRTPS